MKTIEIDEELYHYIASQTQFIGESASSILRRLLAVEIPKSVIIKSPAISDNVKAVKVIQPNAGLVFDYINKEELSMQRGVVGRFLLILQILYRVHQNDFGVISSIRGRGRLYFADNESALVEGGSSTKPRQIPSSPYWVITNTNTMRKKVMLTDVVLALGYSNTQAEQLCELL